MGLFHKHAWREIGREFGYKDAAWGHFTLKQTWSNDRVVTCITYVCDRCLKSRQIFLEGHVSKENNPIPTAFTKAF